MSQSKYYSIFKVMTQDGRSYVLNLKFNESLYNIVSLTQCKHDKQNQEPKLVQSHDEL